MCTKKVLLQRGFDILQNNLELTEERGAQRQKTGTTCIGDSDEDKDYRDDTKIFTIIFTIQ